MTQFKEGDVVVCVKTVRPEWYTIGKEYEVIPLFQTIAVIDNEGDKNQFGISSNSNIHKFVLVSEYKKEQEESVSEETPLPKEFKIRIKDENHSRIVQEWLFERGYCWAYGDKKYAHLDAKHLYCEADTITYTHDYENDRKFFNDYDLPEIEFDIVTTVVPRVVEKEEIIEIKGKKYNLKDVLKAIENGDVNALD